MFRRRNDESKLRVDEILSMVKREGFDNVWRKSYSFLRKPGRRIELSTSVKGKSHPLLDVLQNMREAFINIGFDEVINPVIIDEAEVYKQYGSEAPIILDRCYYLATLPRPDIGLSAQKTKDIENLGVEMNSKKISSLQKVLRDYKKGKIEADDLVEKIAESLSIGDDMATDVVTKVFPEFRDLKHIPSTLTLRSHMTSAWFLTLQSLWYRRRLPIKLFSVGIRFRREQREDAKHLRVHHVASCVVLDEEINVEDGAEITKMVLSRFGLSKFRFLKKKVTSRYYTPGTEYEGYILNPKTGEWVEVVNYGIYNPIALARYGIEYPVLNVGIGLERVAAITQLESDIRKLVYPQFYGEWHLSDEEIASMISINEKPRSADGAKIMESIIDGALKSSELNGPCEVLVFEGRVKGKSVSVYLYEKDEGVKILGPAAKNKVYVYNGNILGVPEVGLEHSLVVREAREKGVKTGLRYIDAVAAMAARRVEESVEEGGKSIDLRVKNARSPRDVNIKIEEAARRYITSKNKLIDISGPVFIGVRAEIKD